MNTLLNIVSVAAMFVFGSGIIYWMLDLSVGKIKAFHSKFEWNGLQIKDFIFLAVGIGTVLLFTNFILPH